MLFQLFRRPLTAFISGILVCAGGTPVHAQTLFPSPKNPITWEVYTVPEMCAEAARRSLMMNAEWRTSRRDTMQYNPGDTLPSAVRNTAMTCLGRIDIAKVPAISMEPLITTALMTGSDSIVAAVMGRAHQLIVTLSRRTDSLDVLASQLVAQQVIEALVAVRPVNIEHAKAFAAECDTLFPAINLHGRLYPWSQLLMYAVRTLDYAFTISAAEHVLHIAEHPPQNLPDNERQYLPQTIASMQSVIADARMLGASPKEAYKQLAATGLQSLPAPMVRKVSPPVAADYWFRSDSTPKPRRGRVTLLAFVEQNDPTEERDAVLRRLTRAFPQIDVVLMAETHGSVRGKIAETPAIEAARLDTFFHTVLEIPGALSVSVTPFARLAEPDGRKLEGRTANQVAYGADEGIMVVNQDGVIVFQAAISAEGERMLAAIVTVLLEGGPATPATARAGTASH